MRAITLAVGLLVAGITGGHAAAPTSNLLVSVAPTTSETKMETAKAGPGKVFRDCQSCPEMVVVPGGSFRMGDLSGVRDRYAVPVHSVKIPNSFAVGKYEITFDEWQACRSEGICRHNPDDRKWGRGRRPVTDVSWLDAKAYVYWLSRKTGKTYRLLSEAEWEYMARAGSVTRYPWGNEIGQNRANCAGCGSIWSKKNTAPVGQFEPNSFGIHDTVGNVWEWVEDCWYKNHEGAPADSRPRLGKAPICKKRVLRGGSWYLDGWYARSAVRDWNKTNIRSGNFGFRVARDLGQ